MFMPVNTIGPISPRANSTNYTGAQADTVVESVDADHRYVLCGVAVALDQDSAADCNVIVKIGSTTVARHPGLIPGDTFKVGDGSGVLHIGAPGEDVTITTETPNPASVQFNLYGFQIPKTATP